MTTSALPPRTDASWLVLLPVVVAAVTFRPSAEQYFNGEDLYHVFRALNQPWPALLAQQHAGHLCTTFSLLVAACHGLFGLEPFGWFAVLLTLHLVAVALCFRVIRLATGSAGIAAVGSLLWGAAPAHAEALTWFTLSGHVVATIMILAVLGSALARAERGPGRGRALLWIAALMIAATANGAGTAAVLVLPVVVLLMLPAGPGRRRAVAVLAAAVPLVVAVIAATRVAMGAVPGLIPIIAPRFPPQHVPWDSVLLLFVELLKHGIAGPLLTAFVLAPGAAVTWVVAGLWVVGVTVALAGADPAHRRANVAAFLGAVLLPVAIYAVTALVRGAFYELLASASGGEAGALPRYHHLASAGAVLASCIAVASLLARMPSAPRLARALPFLVAAALLAVVAIRPLPLARHADVRARLAAERLALEEAVRAAAPPGGVARLANRRSGVAGFARHLSFPGWAAVLALTAGDGTLAGRRVELIEADPQVRALCAHGRRTGGVVVAP